MTIKLELLELVWLQNINRQPGHFKLKDQNQWIVTLVECGLVYLDSMSGYFISLTGKEVLKRHLPYSFSDLNQMFRLSRHENYYN